MNPQEIICCLLVLSCFDFLRLPGFSGHVLADSPLSFRAELRTAVPIVAPLQPSTSTAAPLQPSTSTAAPIVAPQKPENQPRNFSILLVITRCRRDISWLGELEKLLKNNSTSRGISLRAIVFEKCEDGGPAAVAAQYNSSFVEEYGSQM